MKRASTRCLPITAGLALALVAGCEPGSPEHPLDGPEIWSLGPEPTLHVGVLDGDEPYQLYDVRDALRLPDGRVAVANQGTREVRLYTAEGRFLQASGGEGDGPGQWRAISGIHSVGGDTLLVVDHRLERHGLVDAGTGAYVGSADSARAAGIMARTWHHRGLLLQAPPEVQGLELFGPVVRALRIEDDEAPSFVELDSAGRVWVLGAPSATSHALRLFDLDGRLRATLPLPETFRPTRIGLGGPMGPEIMGVWRDSLDVEHVRAYSVHGAGPWSGPSIAEVVRRTPEEPLRVEAEIPAFSDGFRDIAIAQEIHYGSAASYTADLSRLMEIRGFELPEGARADILDAGPTGWRGRLIDTATGAGCMLSYGAYGPVEGLPAGAVSCWSPDIN